MSEPGARILVVEDERHLAEVICENMTDEGYQVEIALDGEKAREILGRERFDLVILDVMLPGINGFELCQEIRQKEIDVPVLFLTAKSEPSDRIRGLEVGGDDYLPKPFHLRELLLRVAAIVRRRKWYGSTPEEESILRFGSNRVDFRTYRGESWDGGEQSLTHREAMLLKCLAEREGEVISREDILDKVWGYDIYPSTRTIDNFIVRLRKRFEADPENPRHFHTVRGVGYRFTREEESS